MDFSRKRKAEGTALDTGDAAGIPETIRIFIAEKMRSFECQAHDEDHCYRVANLAKEIAREERSVDMELTFIAGLLHDVLDSKLQSSAEAKQTEEILRSVLVENSKIVSDADFNKLVTIIKSVGYKNIIKEDWDPFELPVEYRCVQDADLLDAIGAVGVARCFAYSGRVNKRLIGISKPFKECISQAEYVATRHSTSDTAVDHFFDKLLNIKEKLTTKRGKELGAQRHEFMLQFLREIATETELGDSHHATRGCPINRQLDAFLSSKTTPEGSVTTIA